MLKWVRNPSCAGLDPGRAAAGVADTSIRRRHLPPDRTYQLTFLSGNSKMALSASPGGPRWTWFLLAATLTLFALTGQAFAQADAAAATPAAAEAETPNLFIFMIQSLGWVFAPLLFAVSICLVALIVL